MSQKECQDRWYQRHKQQHVKNVAARNIIQIDKNQKLIINYLLNHPCVDCGESDIVVLQFDHVRGTKRIELSRSLTFCEKTVKEEIAKCDVRCANCHQRRTAERQQSYRVKWIAGVSGSISPS